MSQTQALLKAFKKGIWIDRHKAQALTGSTVLAQRVFDFKQQGMKFETKVVPHKTRYGTRGNHIAYRLKKSK